jgi:hypothetical protein
MSAEDPVIPVTDESSESDRIDSSALPPSEYPAVKEVSNVDSSSVDLVTEPPAQTTPDDTHTVLLKHDTNIPNFTPTNPNGSANGAETTTLVSVELLNFLHCASEVCNYLPLFDTVFT